MKIEIVEDVRKRMKEDNKYVYDVLAGRVPIDKKRAEHTLITTPELFAKIFSPQRIRLIMALKKNKDMNIYQLAKMLNRKYEAVHRDISYLKGFGFIKIKQTKKGVIARIDEPITIPELAAC